MLAQDGYAASALPGLVSSPLSHARMTMELMRGALNLPAAGYRIDDRLREIGYGNWEGLTQPEMEGSMMPPRLLLAAPRV